MNTSSDSDTDPEVAEITRRMMVAETGKHDKPCEGRDSDYGETAQDPVGSLRSFRSASSVHLSINPTLYVRSRYWSNVAGTSKDEMHVSSSIEKAVEVSLDSDSSQHEEEDKEEESAASTAPRAGVKRKYESDEDNENPSKKLTKWLQQKQAEARRRRAAARRRRRLAKRHASHSKPHESQQ